MLTPTFCLYCVIWAAVNALHVCYVYYTHKHKSGHFPEHPKFRPFQRFDTQHWSYFQAFFLSILYIPRLLVGWSAVPACILSVNLIYLGKYKREDKLRKRITMAVFAFFARIHAFSGGCVWSTNIRV